MSIMLVEPTIVSDVFVTGVIPEDLGETMRFVGFTQQNSFTGNGVEYVVVNRVIMSKQSILTSIKETMRVLGVACCGGERLRARH